MEKTRTYFLDGKRKSNYPRRMNELLGWALVVAAALALFALSYNALQVASRIEDYWMSMIWFGFGALIIVVRLVYWGMTSSRSLALRIVVCFIAGGALVVVTSLAFRSINHKRTQWIESQTSTTKAQAQVEKKQWHETPEYDLTPPREAQSLPVSESKLQVIAQEIVVPEPKPEPNLVFLRVQQVSVFTNDNGTMVENKNIPRSATWRAKHPTFEAMIATYHNQPTASRRVRGTNRVSAQLTYEIPGKSEPFHVPRALWFTQNSSLVDFGFNDSHGFVLVVVDHRGRLCTARKADGDPYHSLATNHDVLPATEVIVQVSLISEADGVIVKESKFKVKTAESRFYGAIVTEIS